MGKSVSIKVVALLAGNTQTNTVSFIAGICQLKSGVNGIFHVERLFRILLTVESIDYLRFERIKIVTLRVKVILSKVLSTCPDYMKYTTESALSEVIFLCLFELFFD
jgi:hypothetical protein